MWKLWTMGALVEDVEPLENPRHGNAGWQSLHDILVIALVQRAVRWGDLH